jgi:hypothetical protein
LVEDNTTGLVISTFLLLFLVIGLPWNLLVIATIVKQKLHAQPTTILLLSLAVTDLIMLVLYFPLAIAIGFHREFFLGSNDHVRCAVCDRTGFISLLFSLNSIFTISLMSIDRFLFIYKPLHYEQYVTKWRTLVVILIMWLIALLLSILPFMGVGSFMYSRLIPSCGPILQLDVYPIFILVVVCLAIAPVIVCNLWVCCIVQKNIQTIYKVKLSTGARLESTEFYQTMKRKQQKKEMHLFRVFGTLLCYNVIAWLPIIVVVLIFYSDTSVSPSVLAVSFVLFVSQVTLHPIIETSLLKEVREPLKAILFFSCIAVKAKLVSDKEISHVESTAQNGTPHDRGHLNIENGEGASDDCCKCTFLDICGAAVLFNNNTESASIDATEPVS